MTQSKVRYIEKLVAGQKRVLAHASHELRSPLARLRMGVELIAESADGDKRMARHADATRDIAELDALIGELLLASRLEAAGKRGEALVDVAAVAGREAERAEVTFSADGPVHVRGDEALIARVVRNLIDNALRYGGPKHEVSVRVTGGAGATVVVEDRGPGVPPEYREAIFEPFFRLPGHAEGSDGGVGLGLSLVREISRLHGGDVRCVAREGGGSRFEARFG